MMADIDYRKKAHKKTGPSFKLHKQFKTMSSGMTGTKDYVFKNAIVDALATGFRTSNRKVKAMGE